MSGAGPLKYVNYFLPLLLFFCTNIKSLSCEFHNSLKAQTYINYTQYNWAGKAVAKYFETKTNFLNIQVQLQLNSSLRIQDLIVQHLTHILYNSSKLTFSINVNNVMKETVPLYHNLWFVDSYEAIMTLLQNLKKHFVDDIGCYAVVLRLNETQRQDSSYKIEMERIFNIMFEYSIVNVIIFLRNAKGLVGYSYEPFRKNHCREIKPILSNFWNGTNFRNAELFPNKLKNFNNCTLRVLARNIGPFFLYNQSELHPSQYFGLEAQMLIAVAKKLNFHIELHGSPDIFWGEVTQNGTMTGPYLWLDQNKVDMLFGYFSYAPNRVYYLSESISYMGSWVFAFIKNSMDDEQSVIDNGWVWIPFKWTTWLCLFVYTLLMIVLIRLFMLSYRRELNIQERNYSWSDIIGSMIGTGSTLTITNNSLRIIIAFWSIGYVVLNATYQAKLFFAYSQIEEFPFDSIDELMQQNYTFLSRGAIDGTIYYNISKSNTQIISSNHPYAVYEMLRNSTGNVAVLSTYLRFLFYMNEHNLFHVFTLADAPLHWQSFCAYYKRHSYLKYPLDKILQALRESGVITKWFLDFDSKYKITENEHFGFFRGADLPEPLGVEKLKPVFIGFIIMQALTFAVFILELLMYKMWN